MPQETLSSFPSIDINNTAGEGSTELNQTVEPTIENLYMREVGRVPLLSPEEEKYYARRVQQGDNNARTHMIESNLRMVIKVAISHTNRGLPLMDLIEEGNLGLMHAVEKFDPELGFRFSTYASWWIQQAIERALMNQVRTVRIPVHLLKHFRRYQRETRRLTQIYQREPSPEEIAQALNEPPEKIHQFLSLQAQETSLDVPVSDDSDDCLADLLPDEAANPAVLWETFDKEGTINKQLAQLTARQQEVLKHRYGLGDYEAATLTEIGQRIGITRERVRQIQQVAIKRLRQIMENETPRKATAVNQYPYGQLLR